MSSKFLEQNFQAENGKSENRHLIVHVRISLGTKFQLKLIILFFWSNFPKKGISGLKQKKSTLLLNSA